MSPRRFRCFVHVGLPKTGTTFLQKAMWASRDNLRAAGLTVLMATPVDHFHATLALRGMLDASTDPPAAFTALDRLATAAESVSQGDAFLSHESLAPATPQQVGRLVDILGRFDVHVIITARDLARQIASGWQQRIQGRQTHSYEEFLDAVMRHDPLADDFWLNQDLTEVAARWASHVPTDSVHIVTVPPSGSPRDILLNRFCTVLDVDPGLVSTAVTHGNESLGVVQAEVLRRVNVALEKRLLPARAGYGRVGKGYLARRILAPQKGDAPRLPSRCFEWCAERSRQVVEGLRSAGYPVSGDLADLLVLEADADDAAVTDADVAASAVEALASIIDLRLAEVQERDELEARLRAQRARIRRLKSQRGDR